MKRVALVLLVLLVLAGAIAGGYLAWLNYAASQLPDGLITTNGRIEANQVDIATKLAGRIAEVLPQEGDMVERDAIVARLDASELEAQLRQAEAQSKQAMKTRDSAQAMVDADEASLTFARQEFKRTQTLAHKGYATNELLDQRQQQLTAAEAAVASARAQVDQSEASIVASKAAVDRIQSVLDDTIIRSPIRGRVQYRLIEPGAVLAAGGRIFTLLDLSDVSMTIFLPARDAGRLAVGDEARVVLDAAPDYVFPASVLFVSSEAQFTPKTVETTAEREKLMFRVKLKAPLEIVKNFENRVKSGLRGVAYVRVDRTVEWPAKLAVKLPSQ